MKIPDNFKLPITISICLMVGFLSGISTSESISGWYSTLNKPSFNPPNWIFGPVWTFLYTLMGISAGLIWKSDTEKGLKNKALLIFGSQLIINGFWSILFFNLKNPLLAFIDILLLIGMIVYTIKVFKSIHKLASWLLYPYLGWVSFASILNISIVLLNN